MNSEHEVLEDTYNSPEAANSAGEGGRDGTGVSPPAEKEAQTPALPERDIITLVGPTQAGKTHMLAAVGFAGSVRHDAKSGEDRDASFSFNFEPIEGEAKSRDYIKTLRDDFDHILAAKYTGIAGTDQVFRIGFGVKYDEKKIVDPQAPPKPSKFLKSPPPEPEIEYVTHNVMFDLVDGSGGDLTTHQYVRDIDEPTQGRMDEHYQALTKARGALICLPWIDESSVAGKNDDGLSDRDLQGLEDILKESNFSEGSRLENIAVCITKFEMGFLDQGANAYQKAIDPKIGLEKVRHSSYEDVFEALNKYRDTAPNGRKLNIRVFPCSTYGFVNGRGASNYYPSKDYPGLLTRELSPDDWEKDPGIQDHFPAPLRNRKASKMWHPFNIGSPFFFAATGRVTGPTSFSLEECL